MEYKTFIEARNAALPAVLSSDAAPDEVMASGKDAIVFGKASAALCAVVVRDAIRASIATDTDLLASVATAFQSAHFAHGQKSTASAFITAVLGAGLTAQAGKAEKKSPADRSDYETALVHLFREHRLSYDGRSKTFVFAPRDTAESAASIAARELSTIAGIPGTGVWPDIVAGIRAVIDGFRNASDTTPLLEKIATLEATNLKLAEALKASKASKASPSKRASA